MYRYRVHLLDLPDEILLLILKRLESIDALYFLYGINTRRLHMLTQERIFTSILNFVSVSQSNDQITPISDSVLNRFCNKILPEIHTHVRSITAESGMIDRILGVGRYPNLTELKIYNFNEGIALRYFNRK